MARKSMLQLNGFDELIKNIEAAGGSIQGTVDSCIKQSANTMYNELKSQMAKKKVDGGLINRMPAPEVEWKDNACIARVGYKKGQYNPKDLSDGYKAVFINYGTPRISPRNFIKKAKSNAKKQIKQQQEETLKKICERVKR